MSDAKTENPSPDGEQQKFSYANLCKEHFRSANPVPHFSRKEPRSPLLRSTPDEDLGFIVRVWNTMNKFMNDSAGEERQNAKKSSSKSRQQKRLYLPVMNRLRQEICASKSKTSEDETNFPEDGRKSGSTDTGSRKPMDSVKKRLSRVMSAANADRREERVGNIDDEIQTGFDQTQFILGVGILRPDLRDEIYCHVLRQLTNNSMKNGRARLLMLLNLMIGTYPPSEKILPYVAKFIDTVPQEHSSPMKKLLARVQSNGARFQPPSKFEYTAVTRKQPLGLHVTLMNGTMHSIASDPCTTSAEVLRSVAEEIELEETFGFSLFIVMDNKISSLGSTGDKVFDAVSQCEQVHRLNSPPVPPEAETVPWRLFIRKEMFSPWDDTTGNPTATNLVYSQIVRGIMLGEYVCDRDTDLAAVAAMQYYVEYEDDVSDDNLYSALPYYIPAHKLTGEDSVRAWCRQVAKFLRKMVTVYTKSDDSYGAQSPDDVKAELVTWAKRKWTKSFCRHFDVRRLEGPRWSTDWLVLGVNSRGVSLATPKGDVGMDATYTQIASVMGEADSHDSKSKSISGSVIIIVFADGTLIKCESVDADDIYRLIKFNMAGLIERSTWAIAREEFHDSSKTYLDCCEGDLIQLTNPAADEALSSTDCECTNMATEEEGRMLTSMLHILPCVDEPKDDILRLFRPPNYCTKKSPGRTPQTQEATVEVHDSKNEEQEQGHAPPDPTNAGGGVARNEDSLNRGVFKNFREFQDDEPKEGGGGGGIRLLSDPGESGPGGLGGEEDKDDETGTEIGFDEEFFTALNVFKEEINTNSDAPKKNELSSDA